MLRKVVLAPIVAGLLFGAANSTSAPKQPEPEKEPIPYQRVVIEFDTLPEGFEFTKQKGKDGTIETVYEPRKVNGSSIFVPESDVVSWPVDEVIWRGTGKTVEGVHPKVVKQEQEEKQRKAREERRLAVERKAEERREQAVSTEAPRDNHTTRTVQAGKPTKGNRALGKEMMLQAGYSEDQFVCLEKLWTRESGWNHLARNPSSGAYGIPQSLPASKMASAGSDWQTNPRTQIKWGLGYINGRYGTPCNALNHSNSVGWY